MTTMPNDVPRLLSCGDQAISVDFGNRVDKEINRRVHALDRALRSRSLPYVVETVPTYRALLVCFDPLSVNYDELCTILMELSTQALSTQVARRRWRVPVVYGGEFGEDLDLIADHAGLSPDAFVAAHMAQVYTVFMIGFLPGFCYLGGLDPRLAMPRREQPRLKIPASSISIGGEQTAIGSVEGPSGWHLVGRTPVLPFLINREPAFLFEAGDEILFDRVAEAAWEELSTAAAAGDPIAEQLYR
jgi:KipI family sensor histidine kinase inhibitor